MRYNGVRDVIERDRRLDCEKATTAKKNFSFKHTSGASVVASARKILCQGPISNRESCFHEDSGRQSEKSPRSLAGIYFQLFEITILGRYNIYREIWFPEWRRRGELIIAMESVP